MSNILLTTSCNKNCPYCFAAKTRNETKNSPDMDFSLFKEIIDKHQKDDDIKFLGGEPTIYPFFKESIEYCIEKNINHVSVISNFLFNDDILDFLVRTLNENKISIGFLLNSTDLDVADRFDVFTKNYFAIKKATNQNHNDDLTCGITLDFNKTKNYYEEYLDKFISTTKIKHLRLSIPHPGDDHVKNTFDFIDNKKYGQLVIDVSNICLCHGVEINFDCILFPCMFSDSDLEYLIQFSNTLRFSCNKNLGCPSDFFPDGSVSYCYPCERIKIQQEKIKTARHISNVLSYKYSMYQLSVDFPDKCLNCKHFMKICDGPCLGYFDFKTEL